MDLGAIILDPFDIRHLTVLQEAISETCREYEVPPERTRVAYSAHGELGQRIVVHIHHGGDDDVHEPFLFLNEHDGFGACLSGFFGDKLGDPVLTSAAWSVSRERRSGFCSVERGLYYAAEDVDSAEDTGPLQRLASKLGVPTDTLLRLVEMPDTEWMPVTSAPTPGAVAELQSRLALAPLSDHPPRTEPSATFECYLPEQMCREAQELAKKLWANCLLQPGRPRRQKCTAPRPFTMRTSIWLPRCGHPMPMPLLASKSRRALLPCPSCPGARTRSN